MMSSLPERLLDPKCSAVVILGTSRWPKVTQLESAPTFSDSAKALRAYLVSSTGHGLDKAVVFNLFNSRTAVHKQFDVVSQKLEILRKNRMGGDAPLKDVLVYFVGHGNLDGDGHLYLEIWHSRSLFPALGMRVADLARMLEIAAPQQRRLFVLDCCFSGAAVQILRGRGRFGQAVADSARIDIAAAHSAKYTTRTELLFCSSSGRDNSRADGKHTLFTGSLLKVLRDGIPDGQPMLSFNALKQAAYNHMQRVSSESPEPVLATVHPNHRELLDAPAFRNPAVPSPDGRTTPEEEPSPNGTRDPTGRMLPAPEVPPSSAEDERPEKPPWAKDYGLDDCGTWAKFVVPVDRGTKVEQVMRWIGPGSFDMGSADTEEGHENVEGPRHHVDIRHGFWIFETACSEALWWAVMGPNGPGSWRGNDFPVTNVSWMDVNAFVTALNDKVGNKVGLRFDLPTEIQWEYACRAGKASAFSFGELADPEQVRFKAGSPAPVASSVQNPWGVRGMHGNVWEWCEDAWTQGYAGNRGDERRVARGGSYAEGAEAARSASRKGFAHKQSTDHVGFRCVAARPEHAAAERRRVRLPASGKPAWAFEAGEDRHGAYAVLEIKGVRQYLRWIPPNTFLMGSPDAEGDRYYFEYIDYEIPGKTIVFKQGFWMFDTQCTQQLWEAVMGENPSFFRSGQRPVESVKFDEVIDFVGRANSLVRGLRLALPSEAQWEYACRAGTNTATYGGAIAELPPHEHPYHDAVLDPIAWYGNNSWEEFELDYGKVLADQDPGRWPQKYRHLQPRKPAGTHPVGLKKPNNWGLYDMLGNVWEYCADAWDARVTTAPISGDPRETSPGSEGEHTIRGGSWCDWAVFCRSPCRLHTDSQKKLDSIGFRCVHPADS